MNLAPYQSKQRLRGQKLSFLGDKKMPDRGSHYMNKTRGQQLMAYAGTCSALTISNLDSKTLLPACYHCLRFALVESAISLSESYAEPEALRRMVHDQNL